MSEWRRQQAAKVMQAGMRGRMGRRQTLQGIHDAQRQKDEAAVVSDPPAASASAEGGVEASPVDGTPDSERLLSDGTHWAVALTAVALLATSAMSYGLPA